MARARVDGAEHPIYRTDVTLQGVVVPAGTHRVDFMMESRRPNRQAYW